MKAKPSLEQHIAVFGQSGSGKTVLLSSFYGPTQEPAFKRASRFSVRADDIGQGQHLHQNYLGMRNSARLPRPNHFSASQYKFSIEPRSHSPKADKAGRISTLHVVWHDYPGEWFEQDVSGAQEAERRLATFRSLLVSDVALLLVDGQRLLDNSGSEERYLKSLFVTFQAAILALKDDLLSGGKLAKFPRIWVIALSKADLLPDMSASKFRDLLIDKVVDEIADLRELFQGMVTSPEALSFGEDYMLLSSAKFETIPRSVDGSSSDPESVELIDVSRRIGLDLVLPIATILPLERIARWLDAKRLAVGALNAVVSGAGGLLVIAAAIIGKVGKGAKGPGPLAAVAGLLGGKAVPEALMAAARMGADQLNALKAKAIRAHDDMTAMLIEFKETLMRGEDDDYLLRG